MIDVLDFLLDRPGSLLLFGFLVGLALGLASPAMDKWPHHLGPITGFLIGLGFGYARSVLDGAQ